MGTGSRASLRRSRRLGEITHGEYVAAVLALRASEARKRASRDAVRRPPPLPYADEPDGVCRLCGERCPSRRRRWCSDDCVRLWTIATSPRAALWALTDVTGWACALCGDRNATRLEVDHRRPLWSLTAVERGEFRWWLPFNLWALCPPCHRVKTARESGERAELRRWRTAFAAVA